MKEPEDKLLTVKQVSERCAVSNRTVRAWLESGRLPYVAFGARTRINSLIRIKESALNIFMKQNANEHRTDNN